MGQDTVTNEGLLSEAFIAGRKIGLQGHPSSLVQGLPGTDEYYEAIRGWKSGNAQLAYDDAMRCAA